MENSSGFIRDIVISIVPLILSLSVHEYAHALAAFKLGDNTAKSQGRLTLNPLPHIDIFGTLIVPIMGLLTAGFVFIGWAKPVPVSPHKFRRSVTMYNGMLITAIAGPLSNLIIAFITSGILIVGQIDGDGVFANLLYRLTMLNVGLAVFNMLPVPPLDGSRVLPLHIQESMRRYTMVTFIGLLVLLQYAGSILIVPIYKILGVFLGFWGMFV